MDMRELVHRIAQMVSIATEPPRPSIEVRGMPAAAVEEELRRLGLQPSMMLLDSTYYYTTAEGWAEIIDYIYCRYPMPAYVAERMDCDDFAVLLKGMVSSLFGLNSLGAVLGSAPSGYHAWNIARTDAGWLQLEPQTGQFFSIDEPGYRPEYILL